MAASLYRVDTQVVAVEVSLGVSACVHGEMFLRPSIVTLSGVESIADRLNDRDAFFPLRTGAGHRGTEVLGKAQVRYVAASDQPMPDEVVAGTTGDAMQFRLTLELDTGEAISGVFHAVLPPGKRRPLDYVNAPHAGPFVPLYQASRVVVINRAFIRRLCEHAE